MTDQPSIGWSPQYQGDHSDPQVVEQYHRYVSTRAPGDLAALESLAMSDGPVGNWHALASGYLIAGGEELFKAIDVLEFLADAEPANLAARADLATAYIQTGNSDRAKRELERIVAVDPQRTEAKRQLEQLRDWLRWRDQELSFQERRAEVMSERIAAGDAGIEDHIGLARALNLLATVPASGVDFPDVVSVLERARQFDRADVHTLELLAGTYHRMGAVDQCHSALLELERIAPNSGMLDVARSAPPQPEADVDELLEVAQSGSEDAHGALRALRSAYRIRPNSRTVQVRLMLAELVHGAVEEVLWLAGGVADAEDLTYADHCLLMQVYGVVGDPDQMERHAAEALALASDGEKRELRRMYDGLRAQ